MRFLLAGSVVALALLAPARVVLAGGPPAQPASGPAVPAEVTGEGGVEPPPGDAADLALWRSGGAASEAIVIARTEAARAQLGVRTSRLLERLEAATGDGTPGAARLAGVRARLLAAWKESYDVLTRRWPVDPTRGCSYPTMLLESALRTPAQMARRADLGLAREELAECVARAELASSTMRRATEALRAAAAEAERALAGEPAAAGAGGATGRAP